MKFRCPFESAEEGDGRSPQIAVDPSDNSEFALSPILPLRVTDGLCDFENLGEVILRCCGVEIEIDCSLQRERANFQERIVFDNGPSEIGLEFLQRAGVRACFHVPVHAAELRVHFVPEIAILSEFQLGSGVEISRLNPVASVRESISALQ